MKKILITGGLGFIGSHAITKLLDLDKDLICVDNCLNSSLRVLSSIKKINRKPFKFHKISLLNAELESIFKYNEIDTIIHFAGLKAVSESILYPGKYYYNNVIGSKRLIDLAKKYHVDNFIFSSSATVYGNPIKLPITENHPIRALNPYAQNKIDIENMFLSDNYFNSECSVKILRYFNPVGAHETGLLGDDPISIPNNLMPLIIKVAIREFEYLEIFGDDYPTHDGTGIRDYIHINDLVEAHIKALEFYKKGVSIFNIGTGTGVSVMDLVKTFEKVNKIKIPFKVTARRIGDVSESYADSIKSQKKLMFKPIKDISEMCCDSWNFAKNKFNT